LSAREKNAAAAVVSNILLTSCSSPGRAAAAGVSAAETTKVGVNFPNDLEREIRASMLPNLLHFLRIWSPK
jgi:hypothetical protein